MDFKGTVCGMSLTELVVVEGGIAVAILLAIVALALGVIAVPPGRLKIARNCFWACCVIFTGIAVMWGITTDYSLGTRAVIVGSLAALAAIAAVEFTRFITKEQTESQPTEAAHKLNAIPISFTMRQTGFLAGGRAGFSENLGDDAIAFVFGPVLVANTSATNRVILDFTLLVNGSNGTHLKLLSGVRYWNGKIYGQRAAEILRKNGLEVPIYLISPVLISKNRCRGNWRSSIVLAAKAR
jgi:hypothetical protein